MTGTVASPRRIAWLAPLAVNVLFGYLAVFPLSLVWYYLTNSPLVALGLTERDPTDNDGILGYLIVLGGVGLFIVLWAVVNLALRALLRLPARSYWLVSVAPLFGPFILTWVFPAACDLWKMPLG
ncbi:hypothetical protein [Nonomuraea sp. GTA35]|uniref:hypothetical protein n=1 Tax=Nonomuraea sp. GTA35 TaxID=1676746 RepID=UPI0035C25F86